MSTPDPPAAVQPADALFIEVYGRLKAMASRQLAAGARGTLDTTAVVHELYLRMGAGQGLAFAESRQFFAYAARAMRHLLIDRARERLSQRAGGEWIATALDGTDEESLAIGSAEQALLLD